VGSIERLELNAEGDLVLATRLGDRSAKAAAGLPGDRGRRVEIAANYALHAGRRIGFELARYDAACRWSSTR